MSYANIWGIICMLDAFMNLWCIPVLELDSHPDHNKGSDLCVFFWSLDIPPYSYY